MGKIRVEFALGKRGGCLQGCQHAAESSFPPVPRRAVHLARSRAVSLLEATDTRPLEGGASFSLGNRLARVAWGLAWLVLCRFTPPPLHAWHWWAVRGTPLASHSIGYMLIEVKPGIVLTSLSSTRPVVRS